MVAVSLILAPLPSQLIHPAKSMVFTVEQGYIYISIITITISIKLEMAPDKDKFGEGQKEKRKLKPRGQAPLDIGEPFVLKGTVW